MILVAPGWSVRSVEVKRKAPDMVRATFAASSVALASQSAMNPQPADSPDGSRHRRFEPTRSAAGGVSFQVAMTAVDIDALGAAAPPLP